MPDQSSEPNDRPPEAHQLVPAAISQLPIMPQLAELHPLRPPTPTSETAQTDSQLNRNQAHSQQQPIIFAVQEAQQSVAHQVRNIISAYSLAFLLTTFFEGFIANNICCR